MRELVLQIQFFWVRQLALITALWTGEKSLFHEKGAIIYAGGRQKGSRFIWLFRNHLPKVIDRLWNQVKTRIPIKSQLLEPLSAKISGYYLDGFSDRLVVSCSGHFRTFLSRSSILLRFDCSLSMCFGDVYPISLRKIRLGFWKK